MKLPCPVKPKGATEILHEHTLKGCVHWFDLTNSSDPKISSLKARPHIIIGMENPKSSRVIISPISDRDHYVEPGTDQLKYPYHAPLFMKDDTFLEKDSVVLLDQVNTIKKSDLCEEWYMGRVSSLEELDKSIMYNYDLFESMFKIYKELFGQIADIVKRQHTKKYSRK